MVDKMLSINVPKHATPDQYELGEVPSLAVERPTDILIKVHAASINPIYVKKASGATKLVLKQRQVRDLCSRIDSQVIRIYYHVKMNNLLYHVSLQVNFN